MTSSEGLAQRRASPLAPASAQPAPQVLGKAACERRPDAHIKDVLARRALFWSPLVCWIVFVVAGVYTHEDILLRPNHPLKWFDELIFRSLGALLPFLFLLPRVLVGRQSGRPATWGAECLVTYVTLSLVRLACYILHVRAMKGDCQFLSDHIFLAACVVGCLQLELMCIVNDTARCVRENSEEVVGTLLGCIGMVAAMLIVLLTSANMFYTAKHYHHQQESLHAFVLGLAAFQAPVLLLLY